MADEDLDDPTTPTVPKVVPYDRFQAVVSSRNELRTKLQQLEQQAQQTTERAATADTLAKQLEATKSELAAKSASWAEERGLLQAGLTDPDDVDLAKLFHAKQPQEGRKPLGEWWQGLKADPTKAPRQLQPLLGGKTETTPQAGQGQPAGNGGPPGTPAGNASTVTGQKGGTSPAGGDPVSTEKIREVRLKAQKTGDWSEWKKLKAELG